MGRYQRRRAEADGRIDSVLAAYEHAAMHAQHETARCLLGRRADYVISAIKDNQETILAGRGR